MQQDGLSQRRLRSLVCKWGSFEQAHALVVPFFRDDFRVLGFVGLTLGGAPVWYPQVPIHVGAGELRFKDHESPEPPPLSDMTAATEDGGFYLDGRRALISYLADGLPAGALAQTTNLFGRALNGRPIVDVVYEPPLHRVRALAVRRGRWRETRVSVFEISSLVEQAGLGGGEDLLEPTPWGDDAHKAVPPRRNLLEWLIPRLRK